MMNDLMVDIETLGNTSNSVLLSISAVQFSLETGELGKEFHIDIEPKSCQDAGMVYDASTIMWWLQQSKGARDMLNVNRVNLGYALMEFETWIKRWFIDVKVWGNSARFDCGILDDAYRACNKSLPWKFWNERDVRTLVAFKPEIKEYYPFTGVKHYGLDDAKHQVKYCCEIYKHLNK